MEDTHFYQHIDRLSLFYSYFVFLDTDAYLADQLFIKHQVRVHFCEECSCTVKKQPKTCDRQPYSEPKTSGSRTLKIFLKDDLLGYLYYLDVLRFSKMQTTPRIGGFPQKQLIPLDKRSKKAKREYHAKQLGLGTDVNPVTQKSSVERYSE